MSTPRKPSSAMTASARSCSSNGNEKSAQLNFSFITSVGLKIFSATRPRLAVKRVEFFQRRVEAAPVAQMFLQDVAAVRLERDVAAVTRTDQRLLLRQARAAEKSAAKLV